MIGLKIAGVSLVLFVSGLILNEALRRSPDYKIRTLSAGSESRA